MGPLILLCESCQLSHLTALLSRNVLDPKLIATAAHTFPPF